MTRPNLSTDELAVLAELAPWAGRWGGLVGGDQRRWQLAIERLAVLGLVAVARDETPRAHTVWIATRAGLALVAATPTATRVRALDAARVETWVPPDRMTAPIWCAVVGSGIDWPDAAGACVLADWPCARPGCAGRDAALSWDPIEGCPVEAPVATCLDCGQVHVVASPEVMRWGPIRPGGRWARPGRKAIGYLTIRTAIEVTGG